MSIKFCRSKISDINNSRREKSNNNKNTQQEMKVVLPSEESYTYVLSEAEAGNEMAAVQIDEWSRFGVPENSKELCILFKIKRAYNEMFE
jgi:hypothetical protein